MSLTKEYEALSDHDKLAIMALSVMTERIRSLPKDDREDLFALLQDCATADTEEDMRGIRVAMEEIIAQNAVHRKPLDPSPGLSAGRKKWAEHVGKTIKELREKAGLTQEQLAAKAGLNQPHICRLENAEYTATHLTLTKIAKALGVSVGKLDPCLG